LTYAAPISNPADATDDGRQTRVALRLRPSPFLAAPLVALGYDSRDVWARSRFKATVLAFVDYCRAVGRRDGCLVRVMEIGGGRDPLLNFDEVRASGVLYTVNDISERDLSVGPAEFDKIGFDIGCAVDPSLHGSFDLIVSRMAMQHVDARRAWTKVATLLAPGGVALAFHPVFTAPPWARSELCTCNPAIVEPALRAVGFRETLSVPFWRDQGAAFTVDGALGAFAEARDWRWLASSAYTLARK
jgi:SAM-dependent methyltransferase